MMKLFNIIDFIEIKLITILFFIVVILSGQVKLIACFMFVATIHELGHLIACKMMNVKTNKIEVLPFGLCLQINSDELINCKKRIIIYFAGPAMFFINLIFIQLIKSIFDISYITYDNLMHANLLISLFNLFPIYPLDGYQILKSSLQIIFPYKKSYRISICLSSIFFLIFVIYGLNKHQYLMLTFLLFEQIKAIKEQKKIYKKFLIWKSLNKKEKNYKIIKSYDMYKDQNNYLFEKNDILDDKKIAIKELKKYVK